MANLGNALRDAITEYINSWGEPLEVLQEVNVGYRFVNTPRKLDIVIRNKENNKCMAIECKLQVKEKLKGKKNNRKKNGCI